MMDFKELMNRKEYDFLRTDVRLGKRIILLGVVGSYGYGTEREGSDVDFRGVTLNMPGDLTGFSDFEQYEDRATDTVIYGFNKFIKLLLDCNPNIIEILGLDNYLIKTDIGQILLDHKDLFITKRAAASFGHYAQAQLRKLQNAIARDSLPQKTREQHIMHSVNHAVENINRSSADPRKQVRIYIDEGETAGMDSEIFIDASFDHYPLRRFNELANTMHAVVKDYDHLGKRNHKKDDDHLNKHAMHLIRLLMTGIDLLEKGEIITRRPDEELVLLRNIRSGAYMEGSILTPAFFDIVSEYEQRFAIAETNSRLMDAPDLEQVNAFMHMINKRVILEDF